MRHYGLFLTLVLCLLGGSVAPAAPPSKGGPAGGKTDDAKAGEVKAAPPKAADDHGPGGHHVHTVHGLPASTNILDVDLRLFVWTLLLFLGTYWILDQIAWQPLMKAFVDRDGRIADAVREAEAAKAEAQALSDRQDRELAAAHDEVRRVLDFARSEAQKEADGMLAAAKAKAAAQRDAATKEIEAAKKAALAEIDEHALGLSAKLVSRVTGRATGIGDVRAFAAEVKE
ncbi:MAG TPA: ATP synthase F0 subunit B [Planctomycetia bacterium]|nr:ATP synthase F0 subunit B [Planctomycetia bacterium]